MKLTERNGRSAEAIALELREQEGPVSQALQRLKRMGRASVTGWRGNARWFRVPGATVPPCMSGQTRNSRANLIRKPAPKMPPPLTWERML